jgi:hypothetical protein
MHLLSQPHQLAKLSLIVNPSSSEFPEGRGLARKWLALATSDRKIANEFDIQR